MTLDHCKDKHLLLSSVIYSNNDDYSALMIFIRSTHIREASMSEKARVLCLHGYSQNAATFRNKIGSVRKSLRKHADFVFLDAPFEMTDGSSWWKWENPESRPSTKHTILGWEETKRLILNAIEEHNCNAVFGFSQGAAALGMLLGEQEVPGIRFAILVGGFTPSDKAIRDKLSPILTPKMVVYGENDERITYNFTEDFIDVIGTHDDDALFVHPGKHGVPTCNGEFKAAMVDFITKHK